MVVSWKKRKKRKRKEFFVLFFVFGFCEKKKIQGNFVEEEGMRAERSSSVFKEREREREKERDRETLCVGA